MFDINNPSIFKDYYRIIENEIKISRDIYTAPKDLDTKELLGLVLQIQSVVDSAMVLRCCATRYGLTKDKIAFESISAHTNLVQMIVDRVLSYRYGSNFNKTEDGFTYRELMEVIRRHDLPENVTGDIPDDGARDENAKLQVEHKYLKTFAKNSPSREHDFEKNIQKLQYNMEIKHGFSGKLLYLADKVAATLTVLSYDQKGYSPMLPDKIKDLSEKDAKVMSICDEKIPISTPFHGKATLYRASEMWTIDYLKIRKLYKYDVTGLITAILVMYTLVVRGKWYKWREKDYETNV